MAISPPPVIVPEAPPSGSSASDTSLPISAGLLGYLSTTGQASMLSVTNIGSSTTARVTTALEVIDVLQGLETYLLDGTVLNGLANNANSSSFTVPNVGSSRLVRVGILLAELTPTAGAKVQITNGTTTYELSVPTTTSEKRIEFDSIPESFVNSFQVINKTGVSFPSSNNFVVVVAL